MSNLKPITVYGTFGPNPTKVIMIMKELGLPYKTIAVEMADLHTPVYEKYNPNGRIPAIIDHNNGDLLLWESGAIIEYLIDEYDKEGKISFAAGKEKYESKQWLHFQMSGQGPYFGQAVWFMRYHKEKLPSAIERYLNEAKRVVKVRDDYLRDNKKKYLVGDKCTYADIAFVPWDKGLEGFLFEGFNWEKEYPDFWAWHKRVVGRPAVNEAIEEFNAARAASLAAAKEGAAETK